MATSLRDFEQRLLDAAIAEDPEREVLRAQVRAAHVTSRENTGVGLYVDLDVQAAAKLNSPRVDRQLEGANRLFLSHPALEHGAGTIVWIEDGRIQSIECFAYGESWPDDDTVFRISVRPSGAGKEPSA